MNSMTRKAGLCASLGLAGILAATVASADHPRALEHGPIGVMGDHLHKAGEWMVSARYMRMHMSGNQIGDNAVSDAQVIMQPNALGRMPSILSVVPQEMDMDMTMLGAMYAPSDSLTLMAMAMFVSKDMSLQSYTPPNQMNDGARSLVGGFSTSADDIAFASVSGLFKLRESAQHRSHITLGLQQSVADADATGSVLTPMNMRMTMRLPYAMQVGDEALRLSAGLTHVFTSKEWVLGGQIGGKFKVDANDWHFGDSQQATVWGQHAVNDNLSWSGRLSYARASGLQGMDPMIMAPVQTTVPANYGYRHWRIGLGANAIVPVFPGAAERFGIEFEVPIATDVKGVQMTPKWQVTLGVQKTL